MNSITVNTARNYISGSITMNSKPEAFSSYTRCFQARRPTYWDFKPGYRAVNSPGLHLYRAFSKVAKPWPPIIPTHFGDRHVGPQVEFVKAWLPAIAPGFELQDKSGNSLAPAILPSLENPYIEPQDKLQSTITKDGAIYDSEDPLFLPPRCKLAEITTKASSSANDDKPCNIDRWWIRGERKEKGIGKGDILNNTESFPSANDDNPYNIDRWWTRGGGKEEEKVKGDTFQDRSCVHSRDWPEERVYSNITQLHHPQPQRSTSAEVMRLELQATMQTPSLNLAATSPFDCADEDQPCVEPGQVLLHRLRTRLEDSKQAIFHKQQVEFLDLSKRFGAKDNKNIFPNGSHEDPINSSIAGSPQMDLHSSSPFPRLESRDSINNSNNPIVPCKNEVDLISFDIFTDPPYPRTTTPLYQQTDLLSSDSSQLLRLEANPAPQEKLITLDFSTNDSGTSFIYKPPRKLRLNRVLLLGLLSLFFVALAKLISEAEGTQLWILVLALGLGVRDLTSVK